jgi:hypothetical protein
MKTSQKNTHCRCIGLHFILYGALSSQHFLVEHKRGSKQPGSFSLTPTRAGVVRREIQTQTTTTTTTTTPVCQMTAHL